MRNLSEIIEGEFVLVFFYVSYPIHASVVELTTIHSLTPINRHRHRGPLRQPYSMPPNVIANEQSEREREDCEAAEHRAV